MKHAFSILLILLGGFLAAQFLGLAILNRYIDPIQSAVTGETEFKDLPVGERPEMEEKTAYLPVIVAILIGTVLMLFLIKFQWIWVWKIWFLFAVVFTLAISFGAFFPKVAAMILALLLGIWKIFKPNFWVHNLTELFVYAGLAVIFVPVFSVWSISVLLVLIAVYDAYAVWKSKHMVTLAKSQAKAKVFAGFFIPYVDGKEEKLGNEKRPFFRFPHVTSTKNISLQKKSNIRTAVLGGGDIGFPLIFAGVVFKEWGMWQGFVIPFFAAAGLAFLLWKGNEKKFYPAMPFIGAGCFLGLLVVWVVSTVI
ncbi:hypothetical protein HYX13_03850 [Candidatus Woesearchaeota archaeon]|nr:hypothetical protein [Candidatus Woesearchaeota archaeon]